MYLNYFCTTAIPIGVTTMTYRRGLYAVERLTYPSPLNYETTCLFLESYLSLREPFGL